MNDPDGNGVELNWDKPNNIWLIDKEGNLQMGTERLDFEDLLQAAVFVITDCCYMLLNRFKYYCLMLQPGFLKPPFSLDKKVIFGIAFYFLCMAVIAFTAKGTSDEGDSISHYLFAKTAWKYKEHFFNHWAKPVYVLMAFPFAQFGLIGVKLMNVLLNCASLWFTYKMAVQLKIKLPWIPALLLASIPMYNFLSLGGLTEPMCACLLIAGLLLLVKEKWIAGIILLSFLPFVRSEGLLMLSVVFVYLIYQSKYQYLPLLATGHLFYSIAGYFYYNDLLWVFNKMTYATFSSAYGQGNWMHFINSLPEILGTAQVILFYVGMLYGFILVIRFFRKQIVASEVPELFLLFGSVAVYFIAHSAFWALGIFNSGGILRVMVAIMPLIALVNYRALEYLFAFINNWRTQNKCIIIATGWAILYPFSGHKFAYNWQRDFQPKADQYAQQELVKWLESVNPDYKNHTFYFETVYISELLNIDWFDTSKRKRLLDSFVKNEFTPGDYLVWDDWFAVVEAHISLESLEKDQRLQKLKIFEHKDYWGKTRSTVLFRWKGDVTDEK